jgi:hypothetical protein
MMLTDYADLFTFVVVLMGYSVMTQDFWKYLGIDKSAMDERARKIRTMAGLYAWFVSLSAACLLILAISAFSVQVSALRAMSAVLPVLVVSILGFNVYFGRKGDVE